MKRVFNCTTDKVVVLSNTILRVANLVVVASKLVQLLHKKNIPVFLISGGFRCLIEPVAAALNVPSENIFANELLFYYNGQFLYQ